MSIVDDGTDGRRDALSKVNSSFDFKFKCFEKRWVFYAGDKKLSRIFFTLYDNEGHKFLCCAVYK